MTRNRDWYSLFSPYKIPPLLTRVIDDTKQKEKKAMSEQAQQEQTKTERLPAMTVADMIDALSKIEDKSRVVMFDTERARFPVHLVDIVSLSYVSDETCVVLGADTSGYTHDTTEEEVLKERTRSWYLKEEEAAEEEEEGDSVDEEEEDYGEEEYDEDLPVGFICVQTRHGYAVVKVDSIASVETQKGETGIASCIHLKSGTHVFTSEKRSDVTQRWFNELTAIKIHGEKTLACVEVKTKKAFNKPWYLLASGILLMVGFLFSWYRHGLHSNDVLTDMLMALIFIELYKTNMRLT